MTVTTSAEVELSGTFEAAADAVVDVTFEASGGERVARTLRGPATLVLSGGARVEIEASSARLIGFETEDRTATWDELDSTAIGALFADSAPGPHVKVKLTERRVPSGARILVRGVAEHAPGYRGDRGTPSRIAASTIALAGFEERERRAKVKKAALVRSVDETANQVAQLPWRFIVLQLAAVALLGAGAWTLTLVGAAPKHADIDVATRGMLVAFGALAVTLLAHGSWTRSDPPAAGYRPRVLVFGRDKLVSRTWSTAVLLALVSGGCVGFAGAIFYVPGMQRLAATQDLGARDRTKSGKPGTLLTTNVRIGAALSLGSVAVIGGAMWTLRRRSSRLGRLLLRSAAPPRVGVWGVVDGVARSDGAETLLRCEVTTRAYGKGDKRNGVSISVDAAPFEIETSIGALPVRAAQCDFASAFHVTSGTSRMRTQRWSLPDGASVRLAGRLRALPDEPGVNAFVATGPESLVVFGRAGDASVTGALAVHQGLHLAANLAGLAAIAAFVYVAFF